MIFTNVVGYQSIQERLKLNKVQKLWKKLRTLNNMIVKCQSILVRWNLTHVNSCNSWMVHLAVPTEIYDNLLNIQNWFLPYFHTFGVILPRKFWTSIIIKNILRVVNNMATTCQSVIAWQSLIYSNSCKIELGHLSTLLCLWIQKWKNECFRTSCGRVNNGSKYSF